MSNGDSRRHFLASRQQSPAVQPQVDAALRRRLAALVDNYCQTVKFASPAERLGVITNMVRAIRYGLTVEQIEAAAGNYAADEWVMANDRRLRKSVRAFFVYENLIEWLTPVRRPARVPRPPSDPGLAGLARLDELLDSEEYV